VTWGIGLYLDYSGVYVRVLLHGAICCTGGLKIGVEESNKSDFLVPNYLVGFAQVQKLWWFKIITCFYLYLRPFLPHTEAEL